jgi:hypothetical protein
MRVALKDPRNGSIANVTDDSSSTPMVGPDGDVYYGVLGNPFNVRGWICTSPPTSRRSRRRAVLAGQHRLRRADIRGAVVTAARAT